MNKCLLCIAVIVFLVGGPFSRPSNSQQPSAPQPAAQPPAGQRSGPQQPAAESAVTRLDGSTIAPAEIDATVNRLMKAADVTGVAIAIFNDGKDAYLKAYGFRDKERNLPLTVDSVMSAASISKSAFAYLVMQMVDLKVIDLDKPVYEYLPKPLPEYEKYADLANDPRYKRITARMLLDHTSGFPNWRWLEDDRKLKIHFDPGARYAYSGEGIDLLQLEIETVTHQPLEMLMQEYVFQPFGMKRTSMLWQPRFESDFANGYDEYQRSLGPHRWTRADAAGSMNITITDLAKLLEAVMKGRGLHSDIRAQMLRAQIPIHSKHQFPSLNEETTDENDGIKLSYGLGWGLYWSPYGEAFFKEGHDEGWRNYLVVFDQKKSGIAILTNSSNGEGIFKDLLETLLKDNFTPIEWEGYTPYDRLPPRPALAQHTRINVDGALLDRYAGRYGATPDLVVTMRREGDHLTMQEDDEEKQELDPMSSTDFFSTSSDDTWTFQSDVQGHATGVVLHLGKRDVAMKRAE
jgi:CubicO group peptidase (beta-lactamase class C family)